MSLRLRLCSAALVAAFVVAAAPAGAATYTVGLSETGSAPMSFPKGDRQRGVFMEILDAIGARTGDRFVEVHAPTSRLQSLFERKEIDIEPGINPAWRQDQAAISLYTRSFSSVADVFVKRIETGAVAPAKGPLVVGTVRGYVYPKLEPLLKRKELVREDADNEVQLLQMLKKKRVDMVLMSRITALYYLKMDPAVKGRIDRTLDSVPVMFRLHKDKKELMPRLDRELEKLLESGDVARIFEKYR